MTRILTSLICLGLVLTISPAAAQLPENWTTVDILAVKWMSGLAVQEVQILDDETFHDAAIIKDGEELEWVLTCIQCDASSSKGNKCKACDVNLEFAILDLHWVADLHELTEAFIKQAKNLDQNGSFSTAVPGRGQKKRQFDGFGDYDPSNRGRGKGERNKWKITSKVASIQPGASSELWKYTIAVEDPAASASNDCLTFPGGNARLDLDCCAKSAECDTWDPHVYTHPGRKK